MAVKKRGLGRGLDALLSGPSVSALEEQAVTIDQKELQHLPVELIQRGKYQPRRDMDPEALEELAHSIRNHGVMQPIVVARSTVAATRSLPVSAAGALPSRPVSTPSRRWCAKCRMKPPSPWR
jgi:chromosome segregation DNA-binding protein